MRSVKILRLILAAVLATASAGSAAGENVLRWASAGGVLTWDPHAIDETPSLVGFRQVYESLVTIDADLVPRPALRCHGGRSIRRPGRSSCAKA
jgi:ABC-type oligopeptide transport system substrate-binding subunit